MALRGGIRVEPRPLPDLPDDRLHALAIDLGTGGPKAAVVTAGGRVVAHAFEPVPLTLLPGGGAEQDPGHWWAASVAAARRAIAESEVDVDSVVAVGCTAQWLGTVAVGADGTALGGAIIWMDSRGSSAVRRAFGGPVAGYGPTKAARWIRMTGGAPSLSGKDPVGHILWLKEARPEVYAATEVFLEPVDYLNLRLTGLARASYDSITMHWVTDNRRIDRVDYDAGLLGVSGIDRRRLPDLLPTATVVGGLTDPAAAELGLRPGTAVSTGTGDLHSAAVGSGAVGDYQGHLYIGTSSWISCHVPFKKTAVQSNIASLPSGIPGRYIVADEHETGGACLTWVRDQLLWPEGGGPAPADAFGRMNAMAQAVTPGSGGVMFTPWLNGERSPVEDHTIRGGFHNLSLSSTRAEMVRAVFEGVAFNSAWLLDAVEKFTGRPFADLSLVGGGANSDLWCQLHADVTGRTIRQMDEPVLANARGAGLLALLALGRARLEDLGAMATVRAEYRADPAAAAVYQPMNEEFVNLYKRTKGIHRRLNGRRLSADAGA